MSLSSSFPSPRAPFATSGEFWITAGRRDLDPFSSGTHCRLTCHKRWKQVAEFRLTYSFSAHCEQLSTSYMKVRCCWFFHFYLYVWFWCVNLRDAFKIIWNLKLKYWEGSIHHVFLAWITFPIFLGIMKKNINFNSLRYNNVKNVRILLANNLLIFRWPW